MDLQRIGHPVVGYFNPSERDLGRIHDQVNTALSSDGEARKEQLKNVTQEFEGLFLGYLLKVMRSTVDPADDESPESGKDIYTELFDNEIALNIARNRPLGLGEMLYRQLAEPQPG